jgi:preprotein translocase subunit SecE
MWLINYIREVRAELSHVSWPTPRQSVVYTIIVVGISIVVSAYLGVLDYAFELILKKVV